MKKPSTIICFNPVKTIINAPTLLKSSVQFDIYQNIVYIFYTSPKEYHFITTEYFDEKEVSWKHKKAP